MSIDEAKAGKAQPDDMSTDAAEKLLHLLGGPVGAIFSLLDIRDVVIDAICIDRPPRQIDFSRDIFALAPAPSGDRKPCRAGVIRKSGFAIQICVLMAADIVAAMNAQPQMVDLQTVQFRRSARRCCH